jgi:hypothetical protein
MGSTRRLAPGTSLRVARWSLAAALAGFAAFTLIGPAHADSAYSMTASARGVSYVMSNPGFPLVQSVQANTPTAEVVLNSRGQASGYSAAPDPGQDVAELPATGSAQFCGILAGQGIDLPGCETVAKAIPAYPYAYAQSGDAPDDRNFAGAHLHAEATDSSAEAQTVLGPSGAASAESTARATVGSDESTITSAVTSVDSLEFGNYIRLTGIRSVATAHRDPSGHLKLTSSFSISHLHVNGLDVGYDDGSFQVLGRKLPVKLPVQTVLSALRAAGMKATFLPETRTKTGVTSGGVLLSFKLPGAPAGIVPPIPLPLPIGIGLPSTPTTVTYVLGRTEVTSTHQAIPDFDTGIIGGTTGGTTPPVAGTTGGTTGGTTTPPFTGGTSSGVPPITGAGGPQVAPPSGTTAPPAAAAAATGAAVTSDSADIYLAFVITALAIFGSASAIRFLGVRLSWNS